MSTENCHDVRDALIPRLLCNTVLALIYCFGKRWNSPRLGIKRLGKIPGQINWHMRRGACPSLGHLSSLNGVLSIASCTSMTCQPATSRPVSDTMVVRPLEVYKGKY